MSPLGAFLSCLLQEHNCTSFGEGVVDNPRPHWQDRESLKIPLSSVATRSSIGLGSMSLHSTARWESSETTTTSIHSTTQHATEKGLIPVVRKPSPIVEPHPTVSSGILLCPIRRLSQETSCNDDKSFLPIEQLGQMMKVSGSKETAGVGIVNSNSNGNFENALTSSSKPLTLSEALQLPLYSLSEGCGCLCKSTDSIVSSASSVASRSKPPLSPKKSGTKGGMLRTASYAATTTKKYHSKVTTTVLQVEPSLTTAEETSVVQSNTMHQAQTLHTFFLAENEETATMAATDSQSMDSPSPRSITDYVTALGNHTPTGRRSLSKTLGVDFQEAAPIQPMRRPSSEPEQHLVTAHHTSAAHRLPTPRALVRRQSSSISVSSSGSTTSSIYSAGSQSSSNSDTIATYPSFCSNMSVTSEATIKIRNGLRRTVTAGDDGTAPVSTTLFSGKSSNMSGAPKNRTLSFLPTALEQVSERSISEHSESTYDTISPTIHRSKNREALLVPSDRGGEIGISPKTPNFQVGDISKVSSSSNQRKALFHPPFSPSTLPVDHESIVDQFEDYSPTDGKSSKAHMSGRLLRILKNKFR
jgi:hypothetical protein